MHQWLEGWDKKYIDLVVPLKLALYGHPDSGGYWEQHCNASLADVGFRELVHEDWRSCFWHAGLRLFLTVYVDDFKLSGPAEHLEKGWELIRKHIELDPPTPTGKFLGCDHKPGEAKLVESGAHVRTMEYDMQSFFESCVELFQSLTNGKYPLRKVPTPFMTDPRDGDFCVDPTTLSSPPDFLADHVQTLPLSPDAPAPGDTEVAAVAGEAGLSALGTPVSESEMSADIHGSPSNSGP